MYTWLISLGLNRFGLYWSSELEADEEADNTGTDTSISTAAEEVLEERVEVENVADLNWAVGDWATEAEAPSKEVDNDTACGEADVGQLAGKDGDGADGIGGSASSSNTSSSKSSIGAASSIYNKKHSHQ